MQGTPKTCLKRQNSLHHWRKKSKSVNNWRQYLPSVVKISANTINRILLSPKRVISMTTWKISSTRAATTQRSLSTPYDSRSSSSVRRLVYSRPSHARSLPPRDLRDIVPADSHNNEQNGKSNNRAPSRRKAAYTGL